MPPIKIGGLFNTKKDHLISSLINSICNPHVIKREGIPESWKVLEL